MPNKMRINKKQLIHERDDLFKSWKELKLKNKWNDVPDVGMGGLEYYALCKWINGLNCKVVVDFGSASGSSWHFMNKYTNAKIIPVQPMYEREGWCYYLPEDIHIYDISMPKDKEIFNELIQIEKPDFILLDNGHQVDIVDEELRICYENKVRYVAVHDTKDQPKISINKITEDNKYRIIEHNFIGNGLVLMEYME